MKVMLLVGKNKARCPKLHHSMSQLLSLLTNLLQESSLHDRDPLLVPTLLRLSDQALYRALGELQLSLSSHRLLPHLLNSRSLRPLPTDSLTLVAITMRDTIK